MIVYLIGVGPGDPELITLKAARIIPLCDVIVYDDLIPEEVLLLSKPGAQMHYVGKRAGRDYMKQPEINELLVTLARQGLKVARLKGGDPCVFGRGGEEALYLKENSIPFGIIPGISSAIAGPTSAGIPPTHRGLAASLKIVTAHEDPSKESGFLDWNLLAKETGTLVFLMGAGRIGTISEKLIKEGMAARTPCAIVQDATLPTQKHIISTLENIGDDALKNSMGSPCIIIVGQVAGLSRDLYINENKPLKGKTVLITRPYHLAGKTSEIFSAQGAHALMYPLIELNELPFELPDIHKTDIFIFTSQNAVPIFMNKLFSIGLDSRALSSSRVYCIGPKTRDALAGFGIMADGMAGEYRAEGIFEMMKDMALEDKRICIPRAKDARPFLINALRSKGAIVDAIFVYETILPAQANSDDFMAKVEKSDTIIFTSPSGVKNAVFLAGDKLDELRKKKLVAIGPVTADTMNRLDIPASASAKEYTDEGILNLLKGEPS